MVLTLGACGHYPADPAGTAERVAATHVLRVGLGGVPADRMPAARRFVADVAAATGARAMIAPSSSMEAEFAALEDGRLDLVVAELADDSPWQTGIAVIEPIAERRVGNSHIGLSPVARAGENRWVMELERVARRDRGGA